MMKNNISIALLDNDPITVAGLSGMLLHNESGSLIWTDCDAKSALRRCFDPQSRPTVLIVDMSMKPLSGTDVCRRLRNRLVTPSVLIITSFDVVQYEQEAVAAGAQGIVSKADFNSISDAIRTVSFGGTWGTGFETARMAHMRISRLNDEYAVISERETEVLNLLSQGLSIKDLASMMKITEATAKSYVLRARRKLHAATLRELVAKWTGETSLC